MRPTVLHLSPHPDDELIGAPATLMALRDAGWRVVNLACGLGSRSETRERRAAELREACERAGFELLLPEPPPLGSSGDEDVLWENLLTAVDEAIQGATPRLAVAPSPADRHPAHALVCDAARTALERRGPAAPRWWAWTLWGAPGAPTLACGFDAARLREISAALEAHDGELRRNDYRRLLRARAELAACQAPELLFGFGADAGGSSSFAELLEERIWSEGGWVAGEPRWLDPADPLGS